MRRYILGLLLGAMCLGISPASAVVIEMDADGEWLEIDRFGEDLPCELNDDCSFPRKVGFVLEITARVLTSLENITINFQSNYLLESGSYHIFDRSAGGGTIVVGSWDNFDRPSWLRQATEGTYESYANLVFDKNGALADWTVRYDSWDEGEIFNSNRDSTTYLSIFWDAFGEPEYLFELQGLPSWNVPVAQVPLPAPVFAFAGALAALGAVRRFRKS